MSCNDTQPATTSDVDDDSPAWLLEHQIVDMMEGIGSSEDHKDVKAALASLGLSVETVNNVHRLIACASTRDPYELSKPERFKALPGASTWFEVHKDGRIGVHADYNCLKAGWPYLHVERYVDIRDIRHAHTLDPFRELAMKDVCHTVSFIQIKGLEAYYAETGQPV